MPIVCSDCGAIGCNGECDPDRLERKNRLQDAENN